MANIELEGSLLSGEADQRLHFWAAKVRALGATDFAGVVKVYKGGNLYSVSLFIDETSPEYAEFIRKLF